MGAVRYRVVVEGELGPRYRTAFEDMTIEPSEGATVLSGTIADQAQLQGLLERIARLGLNLVSVTPETGD